MLSFRPVPKSELLHSPQVHHGFVPKLSPHSGKKHKKVSAHGCIGSTHLLFYVFARRRGDFAEMMDMRGEGRGACSPELTSSQTSRHAVLTASAGVFSVFFKTFASFVFLDVHVICVIRDPNNYCHKKRPRVRSLLSRCYLREGDETVGALASASIVDKHLILVLGLVERPF